MRSNITRENIPAELRNLDQWVPWRYATRKGKKTKIPINAMTGHEADCTDRRQFSSFESALKKVEEDTSLDGVGFVFTDEDPYVGIDVDDCLQDGQFSELALNILQRFPGSYAEISPSGKGLKLWIKGKLPISDEPDRNGKLKTGRKNPKLRVEAYCRGRYFTTTSQQVVDSKSGRNSGEPPVVVDHNDELQKWFAEVFPDRKSVDKKDRTLPTSVCATIQEIVEKASAAANGDKFRQLWAGDCSGYGDDESSADLALCSILAFWCNGDANLIDEAFRASGLCRDKWTEREDYRSMTIGKAIDGCREFYNWDRSQQSSVLSVPESPDPEIQWPDLIDLEEPPIDRLPLDLLPRWYGDMIRAVAVSTETPIEMAALLAMGAISTATMRKYEILIEPGFRQSLNLYYVCVMEPGNRKSAVFRLLMASIDQFEREQQQSVRQEIRVADSQAQTWIKRIEDLRTKAAKAKPSENFNILQQEIENLESQTPVVPQLPQLTGDDATPESVCSLLAGNDERLTLSSAEPDLFDMMMGRYSNKPNLGIYLKAHDGDSHKENRKKGLPISLSAPLLTIVVMAQPEAIEDAGQQKVLKGRGLLARFLFVTPPSPVGHRHCIPRPIPRDIAQRYEDFLRRLLTVPVLKDEYDRPQPRLIRMSPQAHHLWKKEQLRIESDQRDGGRLSANKDWAGKFPAAIARIAANLHIANYAESGEDPATMIVPASTMEMAIQFARVIESHTLRVFGAMNTDGNRNTAIKIIRTIRKDSLNEVTKRECMRADRTVDSATQIQPAIELLIRDGYLIPFDEGRKTGRPSEKYRVNPAVHLRSDHDGIRDKKDETLAESDPALNFVLSVPESDEGDEANPAPDPPDIDWLDESPL